METIKKDFVLASASTGKYVTNEGGNYILTEQPIDFYTREEADEIVTAEQAKGNKDYLVGKSILK